MASAVPAIDWTIDRRESAASGESGAKRLSLDMVLFPSRLDKLTTLYAVYLDFVRIICNSWGVSLSVGKITVIVTRFSG